MQYISSSDRYGATLDLRDLRTQMAKQPEVKSSLHIQAELGRDAADLKAFEFHSGEQSVLEASGGINHFNNPEWQAKVSGSIELKQLTLLADVEGFGAGSVDLSLAGHNCYTAPAAAQKKPKLWERLRSKHEAQTTAPKTLPPDPDCSAGYLLVGSAKLHNAAYRNPYVRLHDINGGAQLHITPTELLFSALSGYLPGGGEAIGELKIDNWLGEVPPTTSPTASPTVKGATTTANKTSTAITGKAVVSEGPVVNPISAAHAYLTVKVGAIPLRTIMDVTAPKDYGDLGFDTAISGPVKVEWGGPVVNIADSVLVDADLTLGPTGVRRKGALSDIPVSGQILGHYDGKSETVKLQKIALNTPRSTLTAGGVLGVSSGDPLTELNVDLQLRDLGEYDQLLRTLGLTGNGKKGAAAIPVALHGSAHFHGTARGAIANLDVKGHLEANNLEVLLGEIAAPLPPPAPPRNILKAVSQTTTPTHAAARTRRYRRPYRLPCRRRRVHPGRPRRRQFHADPGKRRPPRRRRLQATHGHRQTHAATYVWDDGTTLDARIQLANASVDDLLTIAGQQQKIPLTGTVAVDTHVTGTFGNLTGSGNISLANGVAYGEPYESVNLTASAQGQDIEVQQLNLKLHGMADRRQRRLQPQQQAAPCAHPGRQPPALEVHAVQQKNLDADGVLSLVADANGTVEQPNLKANVKLANVVVSGQAHRRRHARTLTARSPTSSTPCIPRSSAPHVDATGQTNLTGDYQTSAKLTIANLDIAKPLALFSPGGIKRKVQHRRRRHRQRPRQDAHRALRPGALLELRNHVAGHHLPRRRAAHASASATASPRSTRSTSPGRIPTSTPAAPRTSSAPSTPGPSSPTPRRQARRESQRQHQHGARPHLRPRPHHQRQGHLRRRRRRRHRQPRAHRQGRIPERQHRRRRHSQRPLAT